MYIGLKQIQYQLGDYSTLLTSSDGIHALTGWNKLYDAAAATDHPFTVYMHLYTGTALFPIYSGYTSFMYCS